MTPEEIAEVSKPKCDGGDDCGCEASYGELLEEDVWYMMYGHPVDCAKCHRPVLISDGTTSYRGAIVCEACDPNDDRIADF